MPKPPRNPHRLDFAARRNFDAPHVWMAWVAEVDQRLRSATGNGLLSYVTMDDARYDYQKGVSAREFAATLAAEYKDSLRDAEEQEGENPYVMAMGYGNPPADPEKPDLPFSDSALRRPLSRLLHPSRFPNMSRKMAVIVAGILGIPGAPFPSFDVTSDGFVTAYDAASERTAFIGSYDDLERNWGNLLEAAALSPAERNDAYRLFNRAIQSDWRPGGKSYGRNPPAGSLEAYVSSLRPAGAGKRAKSIRITRAIRSKILSFPEGKRWWKKAAAVGGGAEPTKLVFRDVNIGDPRLARDLALGVSYGRVPQIKYRTPKGSQKPGRDWYHNTNTKKMPRLVAFGEKGDQFVLVGGDTRTGSDGYLRESYE